MPFQAPRLDDRSYVDLVEEAIRRIPLYCPEWTDHNPSDPGITLIELFAWMTDIVLYRLNRVPDKHYIKFMELIGMKLQEAEPARANVTFWLAAPQEIAVSIPNGTAVSTTRTETEPAITFTTDYAAEIQVPTLAHVFTSRQSTEEGRKFNLHNMRRVATQGDGMAVFESEPPVPGDALYLGFEQDLSQHIIGLGISVHAIAEGAGIDPTNPPYVWEVMSPKENEGWVPVELEFDSTQGFNVDGTMQMYLPPMRQETRADQRAYWLRCRLLEELDDRPTYRVSPRIRNISAETWGITVATSNVSTMKNEIIGRSDGSPGQRFYVAHTPVAPRLPNEHLIVRYKDKENNFDMQVENWTEVSDFADSTETDRHYMFDSMNGELRLAPAFPQPDGSIKRYGAVVPKDAVLEMSSYRYGGGQEGNVASRALNVLKTSLPYIDRVVNRQQASGGLDAEILEDAKIRVPGHMRSLGRAVTPADFEYLAKEASPGQISRVHCLQTNESAAGQVRLLVIPRVPKFQGFIAPESLRLTRDLGERLLTYLDERRLISTQLDVMEPAYHWVQTEVRLRPSKHYDAESVREDVMVQLFRYLNPLIGGDRGTGWSFGRDLFVNELIAVLLEVPGVDFIRSVKVYPVVEQDGEYVRHDDVDVLDVSPDGVVVSWDHNVIIE
ncbi:MAG: putative baseplate assembly protein [Aggregatilineales bacterium]